MYTLLIDGNYFLRRLHGAMQLKFTENHDKDKRQLLEALSMSLSSLLRKHSKHIDNVIFARDYSSWRKKVDIVKPLELITEETEDKDYKANRKSDEEINWAAVYSTFDEFCGTITNSFNLPIVKTYGAEGDDVLFIVSRLLNNINKNVLLWSSDGDMIQLVNDKTHFIRMPKETLHVSENIYKKHSGEATEFAIFNNSVSYIDSILSEIKNPEMQVVNSASVIFDKIIKGDPKDNIPPLFCWKTAKTTAKPRKAQVKKALTDMQLDIEDLTIDQIYSDKFSTEFIGHLIKHAKQDRDIAHTCKVWNSNRTMICLDSKSVPKEIIEAVTEVAKTEISNRKANIEKLSSYTNILNELGLVEESSVFEGLI